jgi:5-methylcytosine-specific restriction protein A
MRRARSTTARRAIWERYGKKCQMCFSLTDERGYDLDHHIPLEIGGDDSDDNLRPLCRPCHRLKTKGDASDIAKAKRRENDHNGSTARLPWPKRIKRPAPPQRTATRMLSKPALPRRIGK